ncbi:MAG: VapC toxin family PIN domain ribonuclease [Puniceicoccales bacterium]|jgi:toxin-antitoxin system PIN domain toxin|nr:VapC toxin family PIN domain ribonuclease [Puniceicoccales bacterium]
MQSTNQQTWLLDGNVLIALSTVSHVHHVRAYTWLAAHPGVLLATCSVTEGTLLRLVMHRERSVGNASNCAAEAWKALKKFHARPDHIFIEGDFSYAEVNHKFITGPKEVTDAWLAQLARRSGVRVATFDNGFTVRDPDVATLIP